MNTLKKTFTKISLILVLAVLTIACVPTMNVHAVGIVFDQVPPVDSARVRRPLVWIWKRLQNQYERQGNRLEKVEVFTTRIQERLDTAGQVLDRPEAVKSVESLSDVLRETRDAMRDPFRLLRDALRAFRVANRPAGNTN